jgi:hypothetical protein
MQQTKSKLFEKPRLIAVEVYVKVGGNEAGHMP